MENAKQEVRLPVVCAWFHPMGWIWVSLKDLGNGRHYGFEAGPQCPQGQFLTFMPDGIEQSGGQKIKGRANPFKVAS